MNIQAPEGGRVYTNWVTVDSALGWEEAMSFAAAEAGASWGVWKLGKQLPSSFGLIKGHRFALAQFQLDRFDLSRILRWGEDNALKPAHPRTVLAAVEEHGHDLLAGLDQSRALIISLFELTPDEFPLFGMSVEPGRRRADLYNTYGSRFNWYAFEHKA